MSTLRKIKKGEITLAYRKWVRPTVKKMGTLHTPIGVLKILDLTRITLEDISGKDANKAGFADRDDLIQMLNKRDKGEIFKIEYKWIGEDPRISLREKTDFSKDELSDLIEKLEKWDSAGKNGPWTQKVLQAIHELPGLKAQDLADKLLVSKEWLKPSIRKLKNLDLTISHDIGYTLSPRGKRLLLFLKK